MRFCYCFGYDVTVRFIETRMFQTSGPNRKWSKVKFLKKYLSWIGTSHRVHMKFHLNCICSKRRGDWWDSGQIQINAAQRLTSMDFSFYDQPYILNIFAWQTVYQSLCGNFFNLSTVPSISSAFQTNSI